MSSAGGDVLVSQLGARMHYGVPVLLHRAGRLAGLATDFYLRDWQMKLCETLPVPERVRTKLRRYRAPLPSDAVVCSQIPWMLRERRRARERSPLTNARINDAASAILARDTQRLAAGRQVSAVYAFDTAARETFEWAASRGLTRILEQCVVPRAGQERILSALMARCGEPASADMVTAWRHLAAREQAEWAVADRIVCPSEFVKQEVIAAGGAAEKVRVVPYGVEPPSDEKFSAATQTRRAGQPRPLRVLFAGEVGVRKGILDVAAVAAQLPPGACEFRAAGRIHLSPPQRSEVERSVKLLGPLGKAQLEREYAEADAFFLPSYLEGSATVTYEALGWGLPVVTTREAGSVVEDGVSGFVTAAGDIAALTSSLATLSKDAAMRDEMSAAARRRAREYDIAAYGQRLGAVFSELQP